MSDKPLVFISHITEEKEVAIELKKLIESNFPEKIDVFVSSDDVSIPLGNDWLKYITKSLKKCDTIVIICSPKSVPKPWINFEFGAGWVREIPIIPVCHSGMIPSELPIPLTLLRGVQATKSSDLQWMFSQFAKNFKITKSKNNFLKFIEDIKEFEEQYTFWTDVNSSFMEIQNFDNRIIDGLKSNKNIIIELLEIDIKLLEKKFVPLEEKNILKFGRLIGEGSSVKMTPNGTFYTCKIERLGEFEKVISNKNFIYY